MDTKKGFYWCARDLDTSGTLIGNHHFILLICDQNTSLMPGYSVQEENGVYFYTISAGGANGLSGKITAHINNAADVKSVREGIDPDEHTSWYKPAYDIESHKIEELTIEDNVGYLSGHLKYYFANQDTGKVPDYVITGPNGATWVNTLLQVMGVPDAKREQYSEFDGVDWGEEVTFDYKYFAQYC